MSNVFRVASNPPPNFNATDYNNNIKYFLDSEVAATFTTLTQAELESFFEMAYKYHDVFAKVYLLPGDPLINYIVYGNEFYDALKNPHTGIDYTPSWVVAKYKTWASSKGYPIPKDMVVAEGISTAPMTEFQAKL
jgi:hypothetical protein